MESPARWILGRSSRDFTLIFLPGILGIAVSFYFPTGPFYWAVYAFFASTMINAGHVYATAWRTFFRKEERDSHFLYWVAPLLVISMIFLWIYLKIPYLWSFVVYATAYHQVAQFYGFVKWYEKLNQKRSASTGYFAVALMVLPFVLFHFRSFQSFGFYTDRDIFFCPNSTFLHAGLVIYGLTILSWLCSEVVLFYKGDFRLNRFLAVLGPAVLYAYCFLVGKNVMQILFPLFLSHGIPYLAVTGFSLRRLEGKSSAPVYRTALLIVFTALAGGVATRFYGAHFIDISNAYVRSRTAPLAAVLTGIYLAPLLCHYVFDAHIWKSKHRDSKLIYSSQGE